ncbi:rhodanese-like domain-containing protein [Candidatus Woesebacteria bacterium]|nr:rhodanese-like domain-containing protein [Candidatus Woesebacteria bacterium]
MKKFLGIFLSLILSFSLGVFVESRNQPKVAKLITVNAAEFKQELDKKNVVILDIRTPEEFEAGRIAGAINIDYYASDFRSKLDELDKDVAYKIYCNSGNRSAETLKVMKDLGFWDVTELSGGIKAWSSDNYPTCIKC